MTDPPADLQIGPYRVLRELGRGGQGVVYLAEDTRLPRKVALKVLSQQVLTDSAARLRFEREADVTARLEHPGICPLYERGETAGAPWIAMRYIEGEALDDRLLREGAPADLPSVLHFFEKAARALHAAHEAGLVHRDIKPGNLMAGPDGAPVILDFGLARDLTADRALTETGQAPGTPAYMSPEQLQHRPLDRRTDVWSLGATLYEGVTGRRPFDAPTLPGLFDAILFNEPPDPRRLRPSHPPELSVVLAKAMEKDPASRYQTALELAEDLARVRRLEPVLARPPSTLLRLRRWVQRNPGGAFIVLLLVGGLAVTALLLRRARRALGREQVALERSQRNLEQTEDLMSFMLFDLREGLEPLGRLDLLDQVARKSREFYEKLPPGDVTPRSRRQRALTLENVGDVLRARGDARGALQSYELARALHEPLWAADPEGAGTLLDRAVNASRIAEARVDLGDRAAGEKSHAESAAFLQRLMDRDPSNPGHLARLASAHIHLGDLRYDQGEIERALESYRAAFGLRERRASLEPESTDARRDLAAAHNCVADALKALGQPGPALERYRIALGLGEALVARDPAHARWQQDLAVSHTRIADALLDDGDADGAAQSYGRALATYEGLFAREPAHTGWQRGLSVTHTGVGDAERRRGRRDVALAHFKRSLELDRALAARDPRNARWQRDLSVSLNRVGDVLEEEGKPAEALPLYEESRSVCLRLHERDPDNAQWRRDLSIALERVAGALQALGRRDDALARWREAQAHHEELLRREPANLQFRRDLSVVHNVIGLALAARGDFHAAVAEFSAAVGNHRELARQAAQYEPEAKKLEETLAETVRVDNLLSGHARAADTEDRLLLGYARYRRGEFDAACGDFTEALADPAARADLKRGNLYAAAAAAARAGGKWRTRALEWLSEDVQLRRRKIAELEGRLETEGSAPLRRERQALLESIERAHRQDPDFASLREDPAFEQVFASPPR